MRYRYKDNFRDLDVLAIRVAAFIATLTDRYFAIYMS